jgi:hypothetical protein
VVEGCGAAAEFAEVVVEFGLEFGVVLGAEVFGFEFLQRMHEGLGDIASAVLAEVAVGVGKGGFCNAAHAAAM